MLNSEDNFREIIEAHHLEFFDSASDPSDRPAGARKKGHVPPRQLKIAKHEQRAQTVKKKAKSASPAAKKREIKRSEKPATRSKTPTTPIKKKVK
jgi:hypothetical protein